MTRRERIGTAQFTDDLGEVTSGEVGDVDIIRACGMAGQDNPLGLSIWRWRFGGDSRAVFEVATGLVAKGWSEGLVYRVLTHLMDDVCGHCEGRGYKMLPSAPVLSDELCMHCQGTGRKPVTGAEERDLMEEIARLEREIAASIMRRLAREMDL
jgi:hypothetical protein